MPGVVSSGWNQVAPIILSISSLPPMLTLVPLLVRESLVGSMYHALKKMYQCTKFATFFWFPLVSPWLSMVCPWSQDVPGKSYLSLLPVWSDLFLWAIVFFSVIIAKCEH